MKTIQVKDIFDIYKLCGLNGDENTVIRNSINFRYTKAKSKFGKLNGQFTFYNCKIKLY